MFETEGCIYETGRRDACIANVY